MSAWDASLWVGRRVDALLPGVVRRVSAGGHPQPRWLPRRVLTVVSADVDVTVGAGAVWFVLRPRSARAREHTALLEWYGGQWRHLGGGNGPLDDPVGLDVMEVRAGGGVLSRTRRHDPPRSSETAPWIACATIHLGRDVGHLLVGNRRFDVVGNRRFDAPERRGLVVAWMSPPGSRGVRPAVVAFGRDGTELSRLGPHDSLDTHAWARLREEGV
ncbi:hypothetical protein ACFV0T_02875 [Streptomyces sp. NPDC059582]|uniref:hypothetical protein n=1 Tax=Streptomyces sp. NPDC059582 TaxID=3346875 RepID=UPI003684C417